MLGKWQESCQGWEAWIVSANKNTISSFICPVILFESKRILMPLLVRKKEKTVFSTFLFNSLVLDHFPRGITEQQGKICIYLSTYRQRHLRERQDPGTMPWHRLHDNLLLSPGIKFTNCGAGPEKFIPQRGRGRSGRKQDSNFRKKCTLANHKLNALYFTQTWFSKF